MHLPFDEQDIHPMLAVTSITLFFVNNVKCTVYTKQTKTTEQMLHTWTTSGPKKCSTIQKSHTCLINLVQVITCVRDESTSYSNDLTTHHH